MSDAQLQKTYNKLHDLLSPTNRHRTSSEIHDSLKRIRRIVLTEGIPELVNYLTPLSRAELTSRRMKSRWDLGYGSWCSRSINYTARTLCDMSHLVPLSSATRVSQLRSIIRRRGLSWWPVKNDTFRTLATDTQFKGKVKEEMLIRLLDAFIWKNHGMLLRSSSSKYSLYSGSEREGLPFTYVQGTSLYLTQRQPLIKQEWTSYQPLSYSQCHPN
jgi:cell cycle arrest protein BUB2